MSITESAAAIEYSLRARFDEICQRLRDVSEERLNRPLGYWALTGDRRLPYALLERKVREIIDTPFRDLAQTPAIGRKKLSSLVVLLERVLQDAPATPAPRVETMPPDTTQDGRFSPDAVAESHWELWRETVRKHQLIHEPLGRFSPSLRNLPTVVWETTLGTYVDMPLNQLRRLKTHGDKRVRSVLEVFYFMHQILGSANTARHLAIQLRPGFVIGLEQWIGDAVSRGEPPAMQELRQNLILPLLNQVELDTDETIGRLVAGRLGIETSPESVIEQAERLNVTRARVYQLLDLSARVMKVRWPEGRWQLTLLSDSFGKLPDQDERRDMLRTLRAVLYPEKLRPEVEAESAAPAAVEVLAPASAS